MVGSCSSSPAEARSRQRTSDPGPVFGVRHELFRAKGISYTDLVNYDVSPDGRQFLVYLSQGERTRPSRW